MSRAGPAYSHIYQRAKSNDEEKRRFSYHPFELFYQAQTGLPAITQTEFCHGTFSRTTKSAAVASSERLVLASSGYF
jgi:hypothetical protein